MLDSDLPEVFNPQDAPDTVDMGSDDVDYDTSAHEGDHDEYDYDDNDTATSDDDPGQEDHHLEDAVLDYECDSNVDQNGDESIYSQDVAPYSEADASSIHSEIDHTEYSDTQAGFSDSHKHSKEPSFTGYSNCRKCACLGFEGSGLCCSNCGHNYSSHY